MIQLVREVIIILHIYLMPILTLSTSSCHYAIIIKITINITITTLINLFMIEIPVITKAWASLVLVR